MNTIQLKNIKIYAFHGCLPEEEKIGSDYIVNLSVKANLDKASKSDELTDTVDYVLLQKIVAEQMAIRSKLLEHVGKRIIDKILLEVSQVNYIKIMVAKVNPPIDGDVELVSVTLTKKR
ncbi:MAG: dihydroneopterin aldolase [Flavobacteriaceae bacterium]|nr:dihydroneopterin aldolase [Flavobacteriaceae bacterium]MDG1328702.1 dihydroneopterin aldolase [Flavobacteriaceae bacterium]